MKSRSVRRLVSALAVVAALAVSAAYAGQAKIDLTGTWTFEVTTDAGTGTPTVTLKQEGEKLTGHYSSATLGEADLTGTVKGSEVNFTFTADLGGQQAPVSYKATAESSTAMKGTIDIAGLAGGTFTGKKK
jgi:hypothetical protein